MRPAILRVTSTGPDFRAGDLAYTIGRRYWRAYHQEHWTVWPKRGTQDAFAGVGERGTYTLLRDDECVPLPMPTPPPAFPFFPPRVLARWAARARRMARSPAGA